MWECVRACVHSSFYLSDHFTDVCYHTFIRVLHGSVSHWTLNTEYDVFTWENITRNIEEDCDVTYVGVFFFVLHELCSYAKTMTTTTITLMSAICDDLVNNTIMAFIRIIYTFLEVKIQIRFFSFCSVQFSTAIRKTFNGTERGTQKKSLRPISHSNWRKINFSFVGLFVGKKFLCFYFCISPNARHTPWMCVQSLLFEIVAKEYAFRERVLLAFSFFFLSSHFLFEFFVDTCFAIYK